ncbi:dTDP-glucose 4,6-dehydratase [Gammaproteobacteria bacterium]|nr:dTDP-glucose 4,6-dehydratase [Gammaproteobacteria bacterium]
MKFFITGGAGFIGSELVRTILKSTQHQVLNADALTYAGNLESLASIEGLKNYQFLNINICNYELLSSAIFAYKPDFIIHLAAESHVDRSIENPDDFIHTNVIGTLNLLKASREYWSSLDKKEMNAFRFHHVSTDEVFGDLGRDTMEKFCESTSYDPSSPYSASKASSDHLVRAWGRTYGLPIIITNCSNNYGPYQFPEKLIPNVILNACNHRPINIYGDGLQVRDWLYVSDHVEALLQIAFKGLPGETYNIGGNNEITNIEVVEKICLILDKIKPLKSSDITYKGLIQFGEDRPGHDQRYAINSSKIQNDIGWTPKENFDTGLEKTVKWYLENFTWTERVLSGEYKLNRIGLL